MVYTAMPLPPIRPANHTERRPYDDDAGLNVLGCRADILGTNCNKLLKLKINGVGGGEGGGGGRSRISFTTCNHVRGQQGAYYWFKKQLSLGMRFSAD